MVAGFGKGVNDYLNHYVLVADAKAVAFLAGSLVVLDQAAKLEGVKGCALLLRVVAMILAVIASLFLVASVFPRTPATGRGRIFWGDIRGCGSIGGYQDSIKGISLDDVEQDYARQNFLVSGVLLSKMAMVRRGLMAFLFSVLFLLIALVLK